MAFKVGNDWCLVYGDKPNQFISCHITIEDALDNYGKFLDDALNSDFIPEVDEYLIMPINAKRSEFSQTVQGLEIIRKMGEIEGKLNVTERSERLFQKMMESE